MSLLGEPAIPGVHEEFLAFFYQVPWPMALINPSECLVSINAAAERLIGRTALDIVGMQLTDIVQLEERLPMQTQEVTGYLARPDGLRVLVEVSTSALLLEAGRQVRVVCLRDLSREQALLEEHVKMAELSGIVRTIATVNHEINNPLFGLTTTVQLLREEIDPSAVTIQKKLERMAECCDRIQQITDRLSRVIRPARRTYADAEGMLDLAQATQGRDIEPDNPET